MSQEILAIIVLVLANVLPKLGVVISSESLTTTISVLATIGAAAWAWYRRYQKGDITVLGVRRPVRPQV